MGIFKGDYQNKKNIYWSNDEKISNLSIESVLCENPIWTDLPLSQIPGGNFWCNISEAIFVKW